MPPGGTAGITVSIDASALTGGATHFGELVLTPDDGSPALHMPITVAVPAPTIAVGSTNLSVNIPSGATTQSGNLPVGMQIIGRRYNDADVLAASAMFERLRPWADTYRICAGRPLRP